MILRVIPAVLVLLLLAVAPGAADVRLSAGKEVGATERPAWTIKTGLRAHSDAAYLASYLEIDDEKDFRTSSAAPVRFVAVPAGAIATVRPAYRIPARTHPSCAAPPTGPPHV
jgi:hypothetical protein